MNLVDTASDGVNAELTVGKKKEEINTEVGNVESEQNAENIENYVSNISPLVLVLLVLGWLLPSPGEIWRGFLSLFFLRGKK